MTLSAGTRLGPYEIVAPLGAGGMGEVYRARDTRLERTVAVKVLPQHLSASPEIRQRFEREAKTISQLSHPHICALYDVGNQDGVEYLVMEYLEGETLADRLVKGPLPLEQTLRHGVEIADALERAHRQGIVHRDLKPGNVMLTKSGVKLLDFGLAKAVAPAGPPSALTSLPTMAAGRSLTQEGTLLGTIQYMAPEQLEGKKADARTDIFALGVSLYEMATGSKAFSGASQASLISSIMTTEPPPISSIQPMSPPALDRVVQACLAKDPEDRWQTAHDVMLQLKWAAEGGSLAGVPSVVVARRRMRERLGWILAGVSLAAALLLAVTRFRGAPVEGRAMRFLVYPPENTTMALGPAAPQAAVSPDGRYLAFSATSADRRRTLWIRPIDSLAANALAGTEDANLPFWSPDSLFIGFFAQGKLKTISVSGGPPQTLADAPNPNGGAWSRAGVIVFAATWEHGLTRVSAAGGVVGEATTADPRRQESGHAFPQFLPDGRRFLYFALSSSRENRGVYVGSLGSEKPRLLLKTDVRAVYTLGHLLFIQQGTLMAQRFDPDRLRLSGERVRVAEEVAYNPANGRSTVTASDNGVLAYRTGRVGGVPLSELVWFDREGKRIGSAGGPSLYVRSALSPDQKRVAVERVDLQTGFHDLWLIEEARSTVSRFTFGSSNQSHPVWSPDGTRIVFTSDRDGAGNLYEKLSSGAGGERVLLQSESTKYPTDWSADGRFIAYENIGPKTGSDLWVLPLFGDRKPISVLGTEFNEGQGHFSPDGHWMAYVSDESGRSEVYVQAFPSSGGKWQISTDGGRFPSWRGDGKELFYMSLDQKLMSVEVQANSSLQAGKPRALFEAHFFNVPITPYTVSSDGRRFLITTPFEETSASPVIVVLNWTAELKER